MVSSPAMDASAEIGVSSESKRHSSMVLRLLLANPSLARLAASWGAWVTADAATLVILAVVAYTEGGVAAVGFAAAARILPRAARSASMIWPATSSSSPTRR